MRENKGKRLQLRPKLVTGIISGFMIVSTLVSGMAIVNNSINVKRIGNGEDVVKAMEEDPTANWDLNKVWIYTDPDGNKVPVPIGWTASSVESERYVNHNVTKTGTLTDLTFTPGEKTWEHDESDTDKAWVLNEDNVWVSQNYHVKASGAELVSNEFIVGADGGYLSIEWSVSSQVGYDALSLIVTNTDTAEIKTLREISGTVYGSNENSLVYTKYGTEMEQGKYTATMKYEKNYSTDTGLDKGYVKSGTILNYDDVGTDSVAIHEYGGLVIYEDDGEVTDANAWTESMNRNQFVWVPVADTSRIYETDTTTGKKKAKLWEFNVSTRTAISNGDTDTKREPGVLQFQSYDYVKHFTQYNLQGYTKDLFYRELEIEYDKTIESIEKYGGFYIGRYETGNLSSAMPVVRRLNTTISKQGWYDMYNRMKNISNNENIQTSMIWGSLWDEALQWIIETGDKTQAEVGADSTNWGNYYSTAFSYVTTSGSTSNKKQWNSMAIPTGSTERNKANNIYDLAGNEWELTLECFGTTMRAIRGWCYAYAFTYVAGGRAGEGPFTSVGTVGCRAFFYIK